MKVLSAKLFLKSCLTLLSVFVLISLAQAAPVADPKWDLLRAEWRKDLRQLKASDVPVLEKQANVGNPRAAYLLDKLHADGIFGYDEKAKPETLFQKNLALANNGNAVIQVMLGNMYLDGRGVTENKKLAYEWYKRAADAGDSMGTYNIGIMYLYGDGKKQDTKMALELIMHAAKRGNPNAMDGLGCIYASDRWVQKDLKLSRAWYAKGEKAAH